MSERRLIEESFPLKEVSEHSKHEKNVRHGHISTLHIWPARRPLAASRAAIIAALMPDPGDEAKRQELNKKITSITKWKTESGPALDYFREEIRKAYGGRAPQVLDMFAGGGAIPLEAMRLGCDVTAIDYNPVAWFILKCTLEFPHRLAGKTWPLPETGKQKKAAGSGQLSLGLSEPAGKQGDLADHVRYWGKWVLKQARAELEPYYPTVDGQPTVAYLWARTVPCPDSKCGTIVPLIRTMWLSKKAEKTLGYTAENRSRPDFLRVKTTKNTRSVVINGRRALRLVPPEKGEGGHVTFEIWVPGPTDEVPAGTMSGAKARCPSCGVNVPASYIKECGHRGELDAQMTAVVVETGDGKEYRLPSTEERQEISNLTTHLEDVAKQIPFGLPIERQSKNPRTLIAQLYGLDSWADLFNMRQLLSLATFAKWTLAAAKKMHEQAYPDEWQEAIVAYLALVVDKVADYNSSICIWHLTGEKIGHTFTRYVIPITWDYAELAVINRVGGSYAAQQDWVSRYISYALSLCVDLKNKLPQSVVPKVVQQSATEPFDGKFDAIVTDPPYYNAIPYADIADFFYVWLRRTAGQAFPEVFSEPIIEKDEELALRLPHVEISNDKTPEWYESGMASSFRRAWESLRDNGRIVMVFAHKDPDAWETLVSAMIQQGFAATASWPIDTEMSNRPRAQGVAALASSIWLVCRKRPDNAGVGRYRAVYKAMEERVTERLRYFWDIGLSGPDFVWAAIGPALESYSAYSEVRRLDGSLFTVTEFLKDVRRLVADFTLGQILKGQSTEGLDEWTRYYLMHRSSFGLEDAPVGECILFSQGYGLDLNDLRGDRGFIVKGTGSSVRLAKWDERTREDLGDPHPSGGLPLIDMLQRLMRLWAAGNLDALNTYAGEKGLRQNELFWAVAQAILEMAPAQSRERSLLEAIVAWGRGKRVETAEKQELPLLFEKGES